MYQSAQQLFGSKVFDPHGRLICKINQAVLDPNNGQILGFITSLPRPQNILSILDVVDWKREFLLLGQDYEFHQSSDIVRIHRALQHHHHDLIGKHVRTESKQKLGYVTDYSLDLKNHMLASITVRRRLFKLFHYDGRLIQQKNILEITPRTVIVRDNAIKIPLVERIVEKSIGRSAAT